MTATPLRPNRLSTGLRATGTITATASTSLDLDACGTPPPLPKRVAPRTLAPIHDLPTAAPWEWAAVATHGIGTTAMIRLPDIRTLSSRDWNDVGAGIARLAAAGVETVAHVDLRRSTRAPSDVHDEVSWWAPLGVTGIFFDHAPATLAHIGQVAAILRVARRARLHNLVLNPGTAAHPIYRSLGATICTFAGAWNDYITWSGEDSQPGDGHLVHAVPTDEFAGAAALVTARRAGLILITDRSRPNNGHDDSDGPTTPTRWFESARR